MKMTYLLTAALLLTALPSHAKILLRWSFDDAKPMHDVPVEGEPPVILADPQTPANKVMLSVLKPTITATCG